MLKDKNKCLALLTGLLFLLALSILPACSGFYANSTNYDMPVSNVNYGAFSEYNDTYNIDYSLIGQFVGWNNTPDYNTTFGFYGAVNFTGYSVGGPLYITVDAPASVTASSATTATVMITNDNADFGQNGTLNYWIEDSGGSTVASGSENFYVNSLSTTQPQVSLTAPGTAGAYTYYARAIWNASQTATASDAFTVTAAGDGNGDNGGGGGPPTISSFAVDTEELNVLIIVAESTKKTITITNDGNRKLDLEVAIEGAISDYMFAKKTFFPLLVGGVEELEFVIVAPETPGAYVGRIIFTAANTNLEKEVFVILDVKTELVLFDVNVEIPDQYKEVLPGSELLAKIVIFNLGEIVGRVDILVVYSIKDEDGEEIPKGEESLAIETKLSIIKTFDLPDDIAFGTYVLTAEVWYQNTTSISSATFRVVEISPLDILIDYYQFIIIIIIVVILLLLIKKEFEPIKNGFRGVRNGVRKRRIRKIRIKRKKRRPRKRRVKRRRKRRRKR